MRIRSLDDPDDVVIATFAGTNLKAALEHLSAAGQALESVQWNMGLRKGGEPAWHQRMRRRVVMLRWLLDRVYARTGASYGLMPKRWSGQMIPLPPDL